MVMTTSVLGQQIVPKDAELQKVTTGYEFTEGPLWHPDGYLLFSDIPANTVYKWEPGGEATVFLKPSGRSNGLSFDRQGRLLLAQHDGAVARLTNGQSLSEVVGEYGGKRLNSPNDLTVKSDGSIYFTDPPFGVDDENRALDFSGVYRYTKSDGLELLTDVFELPNGIVFSPDEERLYVNDSGSNQIRVFEVQSDGTLGKGEVFATMEADADGAADGMKVDTDGNLYSTGPGGLWIFAPTGELLQQVETPYITNLAWGGPDRNTLYITSPSAIFKLPTNQRGSVAAE
jgi:gluconolactonase